MSEFVLAVDLGKAQDFTAFALVQRIEGGLLLRGLERAALGTSYPAIVARIGELLAGDDLTGRVVVKKAATLKEKDWTEPKTDLVIDATGVGVAVMDMIRAAGLNPYGVTITGGESESHKGQNWSVPKRDLVAALRVTLQQQALKQVDGLQSWPVFFREAQNFEGDQVAATGHDTYNARVGAHDDLVLAVAMSVWWAQPAFVAKRQQWARPARSYQG